MAASWLDTLGYRLVARNHRCPQGEVDIVAEDGPCLCFVEVRTRGPSHVAPAETIGIRKQRRVWVAAEHYLLGEGSKQGPRPLRFDVVEVQLDAFEGVTLSLHRNAFDAPE
jgi:putative endonuclease